MSNTHRRTAWVSPEYSLHLLLLAFSIAYLILLSKPPSLLPDSKVLLPLFDFQRILYIHQLQASANCRLWAKFSWGAKDGLHFWRRGRGRRICNRDHMWPAKLKYLLCGPLHRTFADITLRRKYRTQSWPWVRNGFVDKSTSSTRQKAGATESEEGSAWEEEPESPRLQPSPVTRVRESD